MRSHGEPSGSRHLVRRASDPEPNQPSSRREFQYTGSVPLPLPYSPSDYEPSPSSPCHRMLSTDTERIRTLLLPSTDSDSFYMRPSMTRQRSRSTDPYHGQVTTKRSMLAIESKRADSPNEHFELVPYHDWTVISRNDASGQIVLYNRDNRMVAVRHHRPPTHHIDNVDPKTMPPSVPITLTQPDTCPFCHRPFPESQHDMGEPNFMDRNYFRLLASSPIHSPPTSASHTPRTTQEYAPRKPQHPSSSQTSGVRIEASAFNQGYYEKFFVEERKLGRGYRGSVFLCEHELDGIKLGKYAVKKVAIGNNHPWLVKMLREVHLLERLRHPNVINYKHAWLENSRLTPFGPEIPCLFILMECANGGNLEEYMEPEVTPEEPANTAQDKKTAKQRKRERIKRQLQNAAGTEETPRTIPTQKRLLSLPEILSLFLDIVEGLDHLHQQNIVHRDLKPPNLLLKWDSRQRGQDHGNEWRSAFKHRGIPRVLISDFGECEDLESVPDKDRTGATGTLEFMAPEHVALDPRGRHLREYSYKADMWSLGMVLYYLCYTRLPYSNVDDIDQLRNEILAFTEVEFPRSRYDIYNGVKSLDPALVESMRRQAVPADIPQELKMLIRMLLSTDPDKRPSCDKILIQLRHMRPAMSHMQNVFDAQAVWPGESSSGPSSFNASFNKQTSPERRPSWNTSPDVLFSSGMMKNESSVLDLGSKIQPISFPMDVDSEESSDTSPEEQSEPVTGSIYMPEAANSTAETQHIKKRKNHGPPDVHPWSNDSDSTTNDSDEDQVEGQLLLESSDANKRTKMDTGYHQITYWHNKDQRFTNAIKAMTLALKIVTCTVPCHPYSPSAFILYPVIALGVLDFWSVDMKYSFLLVIIHILWVIMVALLFTDGICVR